ncbi:solute carrier family 15 member 2-like [Dromiciops gliroides]|uniref:solute carrier family 15 member 2-like n=1 Tax=Dromiciops gliroides TaxID=33562 RepID=UPI001CC3B794|nr:solute carrier family 15 member 2-like [Dromiciops gliroides]
MEVSDAEKSKDDPLLDIRRIGKYPLSVILLMILRYLETVGFSGLFGVLVLYFLSQLAYFTNEGRYLHQIYKTSMVILALIGATITDSWVRKFKYGRGLSLFLLGPFFFSLSPSPSLTQCLLSCFWLVFLEVLMSLFSSSVIIVSNILLLFGHIIVIIMELLPEDINRSRFLAISGLFFVTSSIGIKMPNLFCFAGEQFLAHQVKERSKVFSFLYMSTIFGKLFVFITPFVLGKKKTLQSIAEKCTYKDCSLKYFGISIGILAITIVLPIVCKKLFFIEAPQGSNLWKIFKCIRFAVKNQLHHCSWKTPKRDHWLDWASEKFSENDINEVKLLFRLLLFISPFPIFWALCEKQKVEWNLQAKKMNHTVVSTTRNRRSKKLRGLPLVTPMAGHSLVEDQKKVFFIAVLLIVLLLVELVFIPVLHQIGLKFSLIKKMIIGMSFIYFSSLTLFHLELQIENSPRKSPGSQECYLRMINVASTPFNVTLKNNNKMVFSKMSRAFEMTRKPILVSHSVPGQELAGDYDKISLDDDHQYLHLYLFSHTITKEEEILLEEKTTYVLVLTENMKLYSVKPIKETFDKPENGFAYVRIFNILDKDASIALPMNNYTLKKFNGISPQLSFKINGNEFLLCNIEKRTYMLNLGLMNFGTSYLVFLTKDTIVLETWKTQQLEIKSTPIWWQLPQLLMMEIGKYLLIVACIEFFYYEAPKGLKVTMQTLFMITVFSGSLTLSFVTYISILPKWIEYFLLSVILLVVIISFIAISYYYQETIPKFQKDPLS